MPLPKPMPLPDQVHAKDTELELNQSIENSGAWRVKVANHQTGGLLIPADNL